MYSHASGWLDILRITTDHLHESMQFTIYHFKLSRVCLQCCEAQPISAISPKTSTPKLQLLHNTERLKKWSGHGKIIIMGYLPLFIPRWH